MSAKSGLVAMGAMLLTTGCIESMDYPTTSYGYGGYYSRPTYYQPYPVYPPAPRYAPVPVAPPYYYYHHRHHHDWDHDGD